MMNFSGHGASTLKALAQGHDDHGYRGQLPYGLR